MSRPHLTRAPIIEAVLDIRTVPNTSYSAELLQSFRNKVQDFLPTYEQAFQIEAQFQVGPNAPAAATEKKTECARLRAADNSFASLVHPFGINLSKMQPYSNWSDLRDRAKDLWSKYCVEMRPQSVTRLALRYINKIDLDAGSKVEDSFKTHPAVSATLPQSVAGYSLQLRLPSEDQLSMAIINQVYDPKMSPSPNIVSVVFDIDTFQQVQLAPNSNEIWNIFETLHTFKNDVFFESLTETVRKKFE